MAGATLPDYREVMRDRSKGLRYSSHRGSVARLAVLAVVLPLAACGPKVEAVDTAQVMEREEDAEVLVFVRDRDGIPTCPWEVLGTIEVDEGWSEDDGDLEEIRRAAARLGGHAVMAESASARSVRVLRFFDPLCNPLEGRG